MKTFHFGVDKIIIPKTTHIKSGMIIKNISKILEISKNLHWIKYFFIRIEFKIIIVFNLKSIQWEFAE